MEMLAEWQRLLLPSGAGEIPNPSDGGARMVVFKTFRFHKGLCAALYEARLNAAGQPRNPLQAISISDAALEEKDGDALLFYTSLSRFEHPPTTQSAASDLRALKVIVKNYPRLRFFVHDPQFSEQVTAGSLREIQIGEVLPTMALLVNREEHFYTVTPQLNFEQTTLHPRTLDHRLPYFLLKENRALLIGRLELLKPLQYFSNHDKLEVHTAQFPSFEKSVLQPLEHSLRIVHTYVEAATEADVQSEGWKGAVEQLIYFYDVGPYVAIEPVMRYSSVEVPLRSQKAVYLPDARGRLMALSRDESAEDRFMQRVLQQHSLFAEQLEDGLTYFYLHRDRFLDEDWFLSAFEQWRGEGISLFGFTEIKGNRFNPNRANIAVQVRSGLNWFNARLKVQFGRDAASLRQISEAARARSRYVRLDDGSLGILPMEWVDRLHQFFESAEVVGEDLLFSKARFNDIETLFKEEELDDEVKTSLLLFQKQLSTPGTITNAFVPQSLQTSLRKYQKRGLAWLQFLHDHHLGGVLADEMGLGKTVQVIALFLGLKEKGVEGTHLVVVPASLLFNWRAELQQWAPSLSIYLLHGAGRIRQPDHWAKHDVVLTTYSTMVSGIHFLRHFDFYYGCFDEAQLVKNIGSQRYRAARLLKAAHKLALTGTPIENNTMDLYAQLSLVLPGFLGNARYFRDVYSNPIDVFEDRRRAAELKRKTAPFVLRRTKESVAAELPAKMEAVLLCNMGEAQRALYEQYEGELRAYLEGRDEDSIRRETIHVLRGLTQLRQICDDPRLLKDHQAGGGESAKLEALMEALQLKTPQHKVLVFSQFVTMLDLIRAELEAASIPYAYLTGATENLEAEVKKFQEEKEVRVFLLSLKAGGTGLNLTAADLVYLVDPWWNPAVDAQAIDRAHRVGQTKPVQAVRLICPGTVEEKMLLLQQRKKGLVGSLLEEGDAFFGSLNAKDWKELLGG